MFQSSSRDDKISSVDTILGPLVRVTGNLTSEGDVEIAGAFEDGEIKIGGCLRIAEGANVKADIAAESVEVSGTVKGNIKVSKVVNITATGKVQGNIQSNGTNGNLIIQAGGVFIGTSVVQENSKEQHLAEEEKEKEKEEIL